MEPNRKPAAITPRGLHVAADYAWRLLVIAAAVIAVLFLLVELRPLLIAIIFALFLTALLAPLARLARERLGLGPGLAAALALLGGLLAFSAVWALIVPAFVSQVGELGTSLEEGIDEASTWLLEGPLEVSQADIDRYVENGLDQLGENSGVVATGVFAGALLAFELIAAILLGIVASFFILRDRSKIWDWIVGLFSPRVRGDLQELGERSWDVVGGYIRGVSIVAVFDAILIGVALVILGVPAALPLAVLTFFGAFVPFVGAVLAGLLAALVALVANGLTTAIIVVVVVIVVQQIEGDVLYPLVVGRTVELHPLATLMAITAGAILGGVGGAIIAIPVAAVLASALAYSQERRTAPSTPPAPADSG